MVRRALIVLCVVFVCIFVASCGQTYEVQSISVTPAYVAIAGYGEQPYTVTATYSNSKTADVTGSSVYTIQSSALYATDPSAVPLGSVRPSSSGMVQVIGPACTFPAGVVSTQGSPYTLEVQYTNNSKTVTGYATIDVNNTSGCNAL